MEFVNFKARGKERIARVCLITTEYTSTTVTFYIISGSRVNQLSSANI